MSTDKSQPANEKFHINLSLKNRFNLALILISILSIASIGNVLFWHGRKTVIKTAFENLETLNNIKKTELENYFERLTNDVRLLSDDKTIQDASRELKESFRLLPVDQKNKLSGNVYENTYLNVKNFYTSELIPTLNQHSIIEYTPDDFLPSEPRTVFLQNLYIAANPNDYNNKKLFDKPLEAGEYSQKHFSFHPYIRNLIEKHDFADLLLVDSETGHVFYSVAKNIDYGTSLLSGPFYKTEIGRLFRSISGNDLKSSVEITDVTYYPGMLNQPFVFIACPVNIKGLKTAVLIVKIPLKNVESVLVSNQNYSALGLANSGDIVILGSDDGFRTNPRAFLANKKSYIKSINQRITSNTIIRKINALDQVLLHLKSDQINKSYKPGIDEPGKYHSSFINKTISVAQALDIDDLGWNLITSITRKEAFKANRVSTWLFFFSTIIFMIVIFLIGNLYATSLVKRILRIKTGIIALSKGESIDHLSKTANDEIGETITAVNILNSRINEATNFAADIGKGNFELDFRPQSDRDKLGIALSDMKTALVENRNAERQRASEEKQRNWITQGIAQFSDLLRQNNNEIDKLTVNLVSQLVEYLNAKLAGIFLLNEEDEDNTFLELTAMYAYDRQKYNKKQVKIGEGLIGACAMEKKTILLKKVPDDYVQVTSAFGESKPKTLLIVPMLVDNKVLGVIEIGSFNTFEPYEIEFIEKIAENIGSTLVSLRVNEKTAHLLEESKIKSEELAAQEEEMRQNLEELQATQDEMQRIKDEESNKEEERRKAEEQYMEQLKEQNQKMKDDQEKLEGQTEVLKAKEIEYELEKSMFDTFMNLITDRVTFKDKEGRYLRLSKTKYESIVNQGIADPIGKTDEDVFGKKHFERTMNLDQEILDGKVVIDEQEHINPGAGINSWWGSTSRTRFKNKKGEVIGSVAITKDITKYKNNLTKVELFNEFVNKIAEHIPSIVFEFNAEGEIKSLHGKSAFIINPDNKKSIFEVFTNVEDLIKENKPEYSFEHSVTEDGINWNFYVLLLKNSGTANGFIGFAIEKDLAKYDASMKKAIASLLKTKDDLDKLRNG